MGLLVILKQVPVLSSFLVTYRTNNILQYLLFRFFEPKTITYFDTVHASKFLFDYLSKTCSEILNRLEDIRSSKRKDKNEILYKEFESIVKKNITSFMHTIVTSDYRRIRVVFRDEGKNVGEFEYDIQELLTKGMKENSNLSTFFPVKALKKDQKFMYFLKEAKREFDEGCKKFIE